MRTHRFESECWLASPIEEVFAFFSDAGNLEKLTPPWLNFQILTPRPIPMSAGTRIQYRLRLHGIPISWESKISAWDPPRRFADDQVCGPYRLWHHEHTFAVRDGGTAVRDEVTYAVYGGSLVNAVFVAPDVLKIFAYRQEKLRERFPDPKSSNS
jgi:ligand-binding SRPBCC domain-containing protein